MKRRIQSGVRLLGALAVVLGPQDATDFIEQLRLAGTLAGAYDRAHMGQNDTKCGSVLESRNRRKVFVFPQHHRLLRNVFAYFSLGVSSRHPETDTTL